MDALISAKVTYKKIETHLKFILPFSATDKAPVCVTGHVTLPKNPVQRIWGQFFLFIQISVNECV